MILNSHLPPLPRSACNDSHNKGRIPRRYVNQKIKKIEAYKLQVRHKYGIVDIFSLVTSRGLGDCGGTVVKVLRYKSEGRCFDPSWCNWSFSLT